MAFPPLINDITTTFPNEPKFVVIAQAHPNKNYNYPEKFFAEQNAYYQDLSILKLSAAPAEVFEKVVAAVKAEGWDIANVDQENKKIEATCTTLIMRFKDDVVIDVRPGGNGTEVHMRSRSRVGKGDFGANANRIRNFFKKLSRPQS